MVASHSNTNDRCYSFAYRPDQANPTFLARTALMMGCNPHRHFKSLAKGNTVELDDGTIVTPQMVTGKP